MEQMSIKDYVAKRKAYLAARVDLMKEDGHRPPKLVIVRCGDDPASGTYVKGKLKDAAELGIDAYVKEFKECYYSHDPNLADLLLKDAVAGFNYDDTVDGVIVQLPLMKGVDPKPYKTLIAPEKDVDGFHPLSQFDSCTPKGIIMYLEAIGFEFEGKSALVIGRSDIVGRPMAKMLLDRSCSVTVTHSKTTPEDMRRYVANADLIVVAVGKRGVLNAGFDYKPSAVVVDVGINRNEEGKLCGDAEPGLPVALQTPVPGGVGLLTRLALMENTVSAAKARRPA